MFAIEVTAEFCASHALRLPARLGGGLEPLHGHNFRVTVRVEAGGLDDLETVVDFHIVEKALHEVVGGWNNRHLNEVEPFVRELNPSAENVAFHIARSLGLPAHVKLERVEVWETDTSCAIYEP